VLPVAWLVTTPRRKAPGAGTDETPPPAAEAPPSAEAPAEAAAP
jgi:hypothetical protein